MIRGIAAPANVFVNVMVDKCSRRTVLASEQAPHAEVR